MKEVTRLMINEFKIKQLGYDFMGYKLQKGDIYTYHHLIIPKRKGGLVTRDNGAILFSTPHQYLHIIENYDYDMFCYLTSEMIDENIQGYISIDNLKRIRDVLVLFEREYADKTTKRGRPLIREEYVKGRILK